MSKIKLIILLVLCFNIGFAQETNQKAQEETSLINWITLNEALQKQKTQPKKIFVDVYTDWCGWCKHMMKTTFSNPQIAAYINQNYYPVRFDGETKDTIIYLGDTLVNTNKTTKSAHQLTNILTNNRPSYPTITYLDETGKVISPVPGYMDVKTIEPYLVYFTENIFRTTQFDAYHKEFDKTFTDSLKIKPASIKWKTFDKLKTENQKNKKLIVINIQSPWSVATRIMDTTTYGDAQLSKYINENLYPIKLDVATKDTIEFFGKKYINSPNTPFSDLALYLMNNQIIIPSTVFVSPEGAILSHVPGYFTSSAIEPILHFFQEGAYKTQKWETYIKAYQEKSKNSTLPKTGSK
jgi:thioredoxin-related protein